MIGQDTNFERCALCAERIEASDISTHLRYREHAHWPCFFRAVIWGAHHILEKYARFGGTLPADPPGLTRRKATSTPAGQ